MTVLTKRYDPQSTEEKWYKYWETHDLFLADADSKRQSFSIVIPPPNITGILHMGHALNNTLQDVIIRWRRMQGYNSLWLPGTDHAGIATQNVVERQLVKQGIRRQELGREKFVERIWQWREKYGRTITTQLRRLGASCDWSRERFTMDEGLSRAVRTVFKRLYDEGLIYKGSYIINWCPGCLTALSDDEVEYEDVQGKLWYIKYPLAESQGFISVATTRPETMLGDTAVAANADDERYKHLLGKFATLPILHRPLKIIADDFVQKSFGTGLVKVTPAHDPNDYLIGKRHQLEEINILEPDGRINENGGPYCGLDRYECRKRLLQDLEAQHLIEKVEPYVHAVGHCYRCETPIEPYISLQWFVKMRPLAEPGIKAVEQGEVRFIPKNWENTYFHWMNNVRDWCISRQLWWGHRIPAWYCSECGHIEVSVDEEPARCSRCGSEALRQDGDVLDTWFSSALWPFSTLGWPAQTRDLQTFYPTSVLVTGHEIIFFWVARMIIMGLKFMGAVPFREVYINPIVFDEHGEKMSKTKGNIIDPIDVIEGYGTDALRLTLCAYAAQGRNINISLKRLEGYRNFINKLWNAARFVLMNTADLPFETIAMPLNREDLPLEDRWILSVYSRVVESVNAALKAYEFDVAVHILYQFIWHQYCDWYLELVKPRLYTKGSKANPEQEQSQRNAQRFLVVILEGLCRLLHPIIPFVTEEIWQIIRERYGRKELPFDKPKEIPLAAQFSAALESQSIMISRWPESIDHQYVHEGDEQEMGLIQEVIYCIRNIRGEMNIPPSMATDVYIATADEGRRSVLTAQAAYLKNLINVNKLEIRKSLDVALRFASTGVVHDIEISIPLPEELRTQEIARLRKELARMQTEETTVRKKLQNKAFLAKAPEAVIAAQKEKLEQLQVERSKLESKLRQIE
jgi:valyl-tRNA synthetase